MTFPQPGFLGEQSHSRQKRTQKRKLTIFENTKQVIQDYDTVFDNSTPDSGTKIAASAHDMGSGGLAVDAMAIGCLGVERRVELGTWYLVVAYRGNGGIHRGIYQLQGDGNGHVGRPREVSPARPCPELLCKLRGLCRRSYPGPRTCGRSEKPISWGLGVSIRVSKETFLPLNVHLCGQFGA